jgi:hypothetical protein
MYCTVDDDIVYKVRAPNLTIQVALPPKSGSRWENFTKFCCCYFFTNVEQDPGPTWSANTQLVTVICAVGCF